MCRFVQGVQISSPVRTYTKSKWGSVVGTVFFGVTFRDFIRNETQRPRTLRIQDSVSYFLTIIGLLVQRAQGYPETQGSRQEGVPYRLSELDWKA